MKFEHRKEIFEHFYNTIPCTYSLTCEIDITPIVESKKGVNVGILYVIAKVLNSLENFRMYYENEILDYCEVIYPSFMLLNQSTTGFLNLFLSLLKTLISSKSDIWQLLSCTKIPSPCSLKNPSHKMFLCFLVFLGLSSLASTSV